MELNRQTSTDQSEPPRESFSPFRKYARAIASESRRFYYNLTRENVTDFLKTMAWALPLTVLIWVYAESEQQVSDTNQPIAIAVKSRDPSKIVSLDRGVNSIICDLSGPRSNLDRFKETLSIAAPFTIELDTRQMANSGGFISILDNLRDNPRFKEAGITVEKCDPAMVQVFVDTLASRSVPVKPPPNIEGLQDVTFDPPTVTVSGPSRYVIPLTEVTAEISSLPELNQPGVHAVDNVPLQPDPSGTLTYKPSEVKATLTVAQKDVPGTIQVPISLQMTPDIEKNFDISLNGSGFLPKLDVVGPPDQIARLKNKQVMPVPRAVLEISRENVNDTNPVPLTIQGLPDHVHLAGPPPEISFTATSRGGP